MAKAKSVVDTENYKYKITKVRDKQGKLRHSANNDDAVARAMLGMDVAELKKVAAANGLKWNNSGNNGLARMTLGQALRALVRNGTPVKIGKHEIKSLKQKVAVPKLEAA